jgi:hypothetical protein
MAPSGFHLAIHMMQTIHPCYIYLTYLNDANPPEVGAAGGRINSALHTGTATPKATAKASHQVTTIIVKGNNSGNGTSSVNSNS